MIHWQFTNDKTKLQSFLLLKNKIKFNSVHFKDLMSLIHRFMNWAAPNPANRKEFRWDVYDEKSYTQKGAGPTKLYKAKRTGGLLQVIFCRGMAGSLRQINYCWSVNSWLISIPFLRELKWLKALFGDTGLSISDSIGDPLSRF